jgi:hypothetical protein
VNAGLLQSQQIPGLWGFNHLRQKRGAEQDGQLELSGALPSTAERTKTKTKQ